MSTLIIKEGKEFFTTEGMEFITIPSLNIKVMVPDAPLLHNWMDDRRDDSWSSKKELSNALNQEMMSYRDLFIDSSGSLEDRTSSLVKAREETIATVVAIGTHSGDSIWITRFDANDIISFSAGKHSIKCDTSNGVLIIGDNIPGDGAVPGMYHVSRHVQWMPSPMVSLKEMSVLANGEIQKLDI